LKLPRGIGAAASGRIGLQGMFRVVMVYDDFTAGKRAMDTCNFLLLQLGGGVKLSSSMWKFDVLRCSKLMEMAVEDAVDADVIIVANGPNCGLPDKVIHWLKSWTLARRGGSAALVALMDYTGDDPQEPDRAQVLLKQAASTAGIDFLPHEIRRAESQDPIQRNQHTPRKPRPREEFASDWPSPDGWGLNE
jgi:hypothetical protein